MYNSILVFITALFLFNASQPKMPSPAPGWLVLPLLLVLLTGFYHLAKRLFPWLLQRGIPHHRADLILQIAALAVFEAILVCCQPGYYWVKLPLVKSVTALQSGGGLALFLALLSVVWLAEHRGYGRKTAAKEIVAVNLRANLPIVLPWLLITLLYDIVRLQPFHLLRSAADSVWGFILLSLIALLILPAIMRRIWGCRKMTDSRQRQVLVAFCRQLDFPVELYIWPLYGGHAATAAVIGMVPGFRDVLLTPKLLQIMDEEELRAVIAHEAGHAKRYHLLLSILLIAAFSVFTNATLEPVGSCLYQVDSLRNSLDFLGFSTGAAAALLHSFPALIAMLLFFRFIFGYFLRNFEREADLYSYRAMGSTAPLISAFEKLAEYSGTKKEEKNWHHFGLGERIRCLHKTESHPESVSRHRKRLLASLVCYFLLTAGVPVFLSLSGTSKEPLLPPAIPLEQLTPSDQILVQRKGMDFLSRSQEASWYRQVGDILIKRRYEREGIASYEKSLQLDPYNPVTLNNLAWLLVASEDLALRNPERALELALEATMWRQNGLFYDTLAAVYWANGMTKEALKAEEKAMMLDPARRSYYQGQAWRFRSTNYAELLPAAGKEASPDNRQDNHSPIEEE